MNDESVIDRQMSNSSHEFTISDLDGDEEIWILYEPNIGRDGHFKMSIMLERTTQSVAFQQVVETVN